ncbi:MAG: cytochrome c554 family protein [Candidatus Firestonebacteria bacterium]|nr:cytochrome c554 family protein [Candidatus Firestonebacteria bacterium]
MNFTSNQNSTKVDQFSKPEICGKCHIEIYNQWKGSMHNKAFYDPIWQAVTKLFSNDLLTEEQVLVMKSCIKCHTPLGYFSGSILSPKDDYSKLDELPSQGVFCNWCHSINEAEHIGDAVYKMDSTDIKSELSRMLGPFKDSYTEAHPSKYSEFHTKSEFCGLCHNVTHAKNKFKLENTYEEWKNSPYNTGDPRTSIHCQDCHMRQKPGIPVTGKTKMPDNPGKAAKDGPDRKHIWTHYFIGANALVPKLLGSEVHSDMAIEKLTNAAALEIIREGEYSKNKHAKINIKVINSGAGHYLPTGITELRQMWLDIKITDGENKIIFRSGTLDDNGKISENAVIYNTVFGDAKDNPVLNIAIAEKILLDYRIPPKGYVIEKYGFSIPLDAVSPLKIEAILKYRSISQDLIKRLLKDNTPVIPVIDMTRDYEEISF